MIQEYQILKFLSEKFAATDTYNKLGLTQCAVVSKVNPFPVGDADKVFPCVTLSPAEPHQFLPPDENTQEALYNVKLTYFRHLVDGDYQSDVMSRELGMIANEFKAWADLSGLLPGEAVAQQMYLSGAFETVEGWFESEKTGENAAVFGYFNLTIRITNEL